MYHLIFCIASFAAGFFASRKCKTSSLCFDFKYKQFFTIIDGRKLYLNRNNLTEKCKIVIDGVDYPSRGNFVFGLPHIADRSLNLMKETRDSSHIRIFLQGEQIVV